MKKIWRPTVDMISPYIPGKPIEEVKRELSLEKVIKLASNENPLGPSPKAIAAILEGSRNVNRYPDGGCFYLRQALAKELSVSGGNIVFGNGSDEIILLALRGFLEPGDEVVVADPTFLIYHIASMINGARVRTVPLKGYRYDIDRMIASVNRRTKVIFIANPDNPTGSYITREGMTRLAEKVPEDVIVFVDEAYYEFAKGGDYPETIGLIGRPDRSFIITRTFSKAYSLAGLRIGYALARKEIAVILDKVREPFNVNSLAQAAAMAALDDKKHLDKSVTMVHEEKEKFYRAFDSWGVRYLPSRANFVLVDTERDSLRVFDHLLKKGVIVREMSAWKLKGFIRVNTGLPEENALFLKFFKEALDAIPKKR